MQWFVVVSIFETGSCYMVQVSLELLYDPPASAPKLWDYRQASSCQAKVMF